MLESELWGKVKRGFDRDPTIHYCRVESTVGSGISDVNVCRRGVESWVELKVVKGNWIHFRNSQRGWIVRRTSAGGRVWVLASHLDSIVLWNARQLIDTALATNVDDKSFKVLLDAALQLRIDSWVKPYPWSTIADKIFST